jgi:RNA polymerase sigma factor (sigma-70 family)
VEKKDLTALVVRAQQGDSAAMNDLIGQCYNRLYAAAYQTVKNQDTACDVTQEACLEIMTSLEKLENPAAFMAWAQRITYHQCTRYFRQSKEILVDENEDGETIFDSLPDESEAAQIDKAYETKEFQQEMMSIINSLPPEQRSALLLHYYERLSVKQIAEIQGTTEGTVKSRLNYGRKAMKKQVEAYEKKNNIKLHSVAPLGLLLWRLFGKEKDAAAISLQALPKVATAVGAAAGETAAAGTAAGAATAAAVLPKVVAGGVAAVLTVGAVGGGVALLSQPEPTEPTMIPTTSIVVPSTPPVHIHQFDGEWEYDETQHWRSCACGETAEAASHQFADNQCLCGQYQASEGLSMDISDGVAYVRGRGSCTDSVLVIPESYEGYPVVGIESRAFREDRSFTKVVLPGSLLSIGDFVFSYTNVQEVVLLPGIRELGNHMFESCEALTKVTLPDTIDTVKSGAFLNCTALEQIHLPDSIRYVGDGIFSGCSALQSVTVPGSFQALPANTFSGCIRLTSATLQPGITQIGANAFRGCSALSHVTLPDTLTHIGSEAFYNCVALEAIALPDSLQVMDASIFAGCGRLEAIRIPGSVAILSDSLFSGCVALTQVTLEPGITAIGNSVFEGCVRLETLVLPESITAIGKYAFQGCSVLRELTIPVSVKQIMLLALQDCRRLEKIHYGGTVAQWYEIDIDNAWYDYDRGSGEYTIYCTDGTIAKSDA